MHCWNANSCFVHIFRFSCFSMLLFWNSIFSAKQCLANAIRWLLLLFWNANVKSSDFLHRFYFCTESETKTTNCQNDKMQKKKEKALRLFYILGEEHTVSKLYGSVLASILDSPSYVIVIGCNSKGINVDFSRSGR